MSTLDLRPAPSPRSCHSACPPVPACPCDLQGRHPGPTARAGRCRQAAGQGARSWWRASNPRGAGRFHPPEAKASHPDRRLAFGSLQGFSGACKVPRPFGARNDTKAEAIWIEHPTPHSLPRHPERSEAKSKDGGEGNKCDHGNAVGRADRNAGLAQPMVVTGGGWEGNEVAGLRGHPKRLRGATITCLPRPAYGGTI